MQANVYEQMNSIEAEHWWFAARRRYLNKIIGQQIFNSSSLKFCEIGAGTGGNLSMLSEHAIVDAVEMNESARDHISGKTVQGVDRILPGSLPDDMVHSEIYDAVFSLDVIEHVEDDQKALVKIKDYLDVGGILISTVPAYQWLWSKHDEINQHCRRYCKSDYCDLLRSAGYDIEYASYFNSLLFPLAVVDRVLSRLSTSDDSGDITLPGKFINKLLYSIFSIESTWAGRLSVPFGLSIVVVAKKR